MNEKVAIEEEKKLNEELLMKKKVDHSSFEKENNKTDLKASNQRIANVILPDLE